MRRNLAIALFQHGAIRTTEAKAKDLKPFVERLISYARKGTVHARRLVSAELGNRRGDRGVLMDDEGEPLNKGVLDVLFDDIAPRYADRPGGYTRIIRLAERRLGDAGRQVILQLVEETGAGGGQGGSRSSRRKRRAAARHEAVAAVDAPVSEQAEPPADEGEAEAPVQAEQELDQGQQTPEHSDEGREETTDEGAEPKKEH